MATTNNPNEPVTNTPPPSARVIPNERQLLQNFYLNFWNRVVEDDFRDDIDIDSIEATEGWGNWSSEQQIKYICRIKPVDTDAMMILRILLFQLIRNRVIDPTEFFALPVDTWIREKVLYKPQLQLKFFEQWNDQQNNGRGYPLRMIVSWRLQERATQLSWAEIKQLTNKIRTEFSPLQAYDKARTKYLYTDQTNGFDFKLLLTETDAKRLISSVLSVMGLTPDWDQLRLSTKPDKNFNTKETAGVILGEQRYYPDFRPLGKVWLHSGQLTVYPLKPISLFRVKRGIFISEVDSRVDLVP